VDDIALVKRVRNLARLKMLTDEMLMRSSTEEQMGLAGNWLTPFDHRAGTGRILVVEDQDSAFQRVEEALQSEFELTHETDPARALLRLPAEAFDLMIVSLDLKHADGLRLCSQVRSIDRTRHLPLLVLAEPGDDTRLQRGLDMGVNDYIVRPIDANELLARARTQVKRKRYVDHLRVRLEHSVEMAILDPLTGLHYRRYLASHLATLFEDASQRGKPLSILLIDIDHFKTVNDNHGHGAGDVVLREFADRIRRTRAASILPAGSAVRSSWWSCRIAIATRPFRSASAYASASPPLPSRLAAGRARCWSRRASASRRSSVPATRPSLFAPNQAGFWGLALGFRLDAALEALALRLYISCVFVTLGTQ
jgi:two-component system cell cycle response regulator